MMDLDILLYSQQVCIFWYSHCNLMLAKDIEKQLNSGSQTNSNAVASQSCKALKDANNELKLLQTMGLWAQRPENPEFN